MGELDDLAAAAQQRLSRTPSRPRSAPAPAKPQRDAYDVEAGHADFVAGFFFIVAMLNLLAAIVCLVWAIVERSWFSFVVGLGCAVQAITLLGLSAALRLLGLIAIGIRDMAYRD